MARVRLDDALRGEDEPPKRKPRSAPPAEEKPDIYKLTAMLSEAEHNRLEWLTDRVLDEIQPRRVGKGWRTKVIRGLLAVAEDDYDMVRRVADAIRDADEQ